MLHESNDYSARRDADIYVNKDL